MSDFNLDSFLAAHQSEGSAQGEGDFTISHSKAAHKMSQFSLPREESWVLKLVQAAVLWNCPSLVLKQTRTLSVFYLPFKNSEKPPKNEDLVRALLQANFESEKAVDHMGTALRILVERGHLSFLLLSHGGEEDLPPAIYAGVYFGEMKEESRKEFRSKWKGGLTLAVHHIAHTDDNRLLLQYIPIRQFGLPMLMELEQYAYPAPLLLEVDGRRFDGPLRSAALAWSPRNKPLFMAAISLEPGGAALRLSSDFREAEFTVKTSHQGALAKEGVGGEAESYFLLSAEAPGLLGQKLARRRRAFLYWVKSGVIVQVETIAPSNVFLGLHIYANAEGLKSDLTGFQLVESPEFAERRVRILGKVRDRLVGELVEGRDIFLDDPDEEPRESMESRLRREGNDLAQSLSTRRFGKVLAPATRSFAAIASEAYTGYRRISGELVEWDPATLGGIYREELESFIKVLGKASSPE